MRDVRRFPHIGVGPIAAFLIERMKAGKPGDVLTDEQLLALSGANCRPGATGYRSLQTAIRHVLREFGIVWERERGAACIRCLDPLERLSSARRTRRHIARVSKKAIRVASIDTAALPECERSDAHALQAQLGTLALFSATDVQKKLAARDIAQPPELGKLLDSFPK